MNTSNIKAVFDNNGETLDRYTIILDNGDMLGLSETGAGYSQWEGNLVDSYMMTRYNARWRNHLNVSKIIEEQLPRLIKSFEDEGNIGQRIELTDLSPELIKHIESRLKE